MTRHCLTAACAFVLGLAALPAWSGTLRTSDGKSFSGAVLKMSADSVTFLWKKQSDQPDIIKSEDADLLLRAQGQRSVAWRVPAGQVDTIDGVPFTSYRALYSYNGFARTFDEVKASVLLVTGQGGFLHQIKSVLIFLALLLVLTPVALMLVSFPTGSARLSFLGAMGIVLVFSLLGIGCAAISKLALGIGPFMATATAQVGLTLLFLVVFGTVVNFSSRFTFPQGLAFAVTWGVCLMAAGRITAGLVGVPA